MITHLVQNGRVFFAVVIVGGGSVLFCLCVWVFLLACVSVYYMYDCAHGCPSDALELQVVLNHCVGTRDRTQVLLNTKCS